MALSDWDGSYFSIPGHAEGTNNAPPGWSWVGEEGPELMRMHGGEQILPSHVSQEVARTYRAYNKYSGGAYAANDKGAGFARNAVPMYASGTASAAPGLALVGEEGPELIYFSGGEKVLDAARTASIQNNAAPAASAMLAPQGGGPMAPVSVTFQIGGSATPEVVQDLRQFADEIVERVTDSLEDRAADRKRRLML